MEVNGMKWKSATGSGRKWKEVEGSMEVVEVVEVVYGSPGSHELELKSLKKSLNFFELAIPVVRARHRFRNGTLPRM